MMGGPMAQGELDRRVPEVSIGPMVAPLLTSAPLSVQVVCTLGPKSRTVEVLEELLHAGMSVARFNFSHGSHEYHQV
jgi:hypothetical protein